MNMRRSSRTKARECSGEQLGFSNDSTRLQCWLYAYWVRQLACNFPAMESLVLEPMRDTSKVPQVICAQIGKQANRQTGKQQTGKQANRQPTDKQQANSRDKQTNRRTGKQTGTQPAGRQTHIPANRPAYTLPKTQTGDFHVCPYHLPTRTS